MIMHKILHLLFKSSETILSYIVLFYYNYIVFILLCFFELLDCKIKISVCLKLKPK